MAAGLVLIYNPVNDRLMSVRLKRHPGQPVNTIIMQVYVLSSVADEENREVFCGKLQELVEHVPKVDVLIIMADLNANIGEAAVLGIV